MNYDAFIDLWRHDLTGRGYALLDEGVIDSKTLRRRMFEVKDQLSAFVQFGFRSVSRFNQQETTRFHQDGGPDQNILVLGYEPSQVVSKIFLADHACAANDLNLTPGRLLTEAMMGKDEWLTNYITEITPFEDGHSYILLVNNSKELGVLHKAIVPEKNPNEQRIINSMMLCVGPDEVSLEEQQDFLTTNDVRSAYA